MSSKASKGLNTTLDDNGRSLSQLYDLYIFYRNLHDTYKTDSTLDRMNECIHDIIYLLGEILITNEIPHSCTGSYTKMNIYVPIDGAIKKVIYSVKALFFYEEPCKMTYKQYHQVKEYIMTLPEEVTSFILHTLS